MRGRATLLPALLALACELAGGPARAELRDEAERLAGVWRAVGATVVVDQAHFLLEGEPLRDRHVVVSVPELPDGACTTIALLGSRGLGFHVKLLEIGGPEPEVRRVPSVAGAVTLERCAQAGPRRLIVVSDSGRGAFETVVARSSAPLPPLHDVLPERATGTLLPAMDPGPLPPLPTPETRADLAEARARRSGASIGARGTWATGADRTGVEQMMLEPGCHVLELFAVDPRAMRGGIGGRLDLDAEMRDADGERLLARDRSDAPDASLSKCFAEPTEVQVAYAGAPAGSDVLVGHYAWPLPEHLPSLWGPLAVARLAHLLRVHAVPALTREASFLAQGGGGATPVPLPVEPGACYVALVTLTRGEARSVGLRVRVGASNAGDDRGIDDDGAAVAFCAGPRARALATVEVRGAPQSGWGLALYRVQSRVWEPPRR